MAESTSGNMTATGVSVRSNLQKIPRDKFAKTDISSPIDKSFRHIYHVEQTDVMQLQRKGKTQLGNNVILSSGCPPGFIIVKLSVLEQLEQEVEDLRSAVAAITTRAAEVVTTRADHIVQKIRSMMNCTEGDVQRDIGEEDTRPNAETGQVYVHVDRIKDDAVLLQSNEFVNSGGSDDTIVNKPADQSGENNKSSSDNSYAQSSDIKCGPENDLTTRQQPVDTPLESAANTILLGSLQVNLRAKADVRECLSHALQSHLPAIIDNVVFRESELPDELIADNCITEDECCDIRQRPNRRDQVRLLLSAVRGRDFGVLEKFLGRIRNANPEIADAIEKTFKSNRDSKVRSKLCARCMMKERVNIKYVCDSLMAIHVVDEGLYNEIICDNKPTGAQDELWVRLFDTLNSMKFSEYRTLVYDVLGETLKRKCYTYLQDSVNACAKNGNTFKCSCPDKLKAGKRVSNPNDTVSSARSSTTDASRESVDISHLAKRRATLYGDTTDASRESVDISHLVKRRATLYGDTTGASRESVDISHLVKRRATLYGDTTGASRESVDISHLVKRRATLYGDIQHGEELRRHSCSEQRLGKHIAEDKRLPRRSQISTSSDLDVPETIKETKEAEKRNTPSRDAASGTNETSETQQLRN